MGRAAAVGCCPQPPMTQAAAAGVGVGARKGGCRSGWAAVSAEAAGAAGVGTVGPPPAARWGSKLGRAHDRD